MGFDLERMVQLEPQIKIHWVLGWVGVMGRSTKDQSIACQDK
jgi:hypothetical protein